MNNGLDFERPILELEKKIEELKNFTSKEAIDLTSEIKKLEESLPGGSAGEADAEA